MSSKTGAIQTATSDVGVLLPQVSVKAYVGVIGRYFETAKVERDSALKGPLVMTLGDKFARYPRGSVSNSRPAAGN